MRFPDVGPLVENLDPLHKPPFLLHQGEHFLFEFGKGILPLVRLSESGNERYHYQAG